jgi:hypothetical protein
MDFAKVISELRAERDLLDEAIVNLERLSLSRGRKPGRPPSWMTLTRRSAPSKNGNNGTHRDGAAEQ